jgi:TM2 domain-containing membrane protein YozV
MKRRETSSFGHQNPPGVQPQQRWAIAAALSLTGALNPLPLPLTGLHKFYLGQPVWGGVYLLLGWTQIPRIACAVEGLWLLTRWGQGNLSAAIGPVTQSVDGVTVSQHTQAIATALRELEKLRQEGLISEQEFEQNRRSLLDKLS